MRIDLSSTSSSASCLVDHVAARLLFSRLALHNSAVNIQSHPPLRYRQRRFKRILTVQPQFYIIIMTTTTTVIIIYFPFVPPLRSVLDTQQRRAGAQGGSD